MDPSGPLATLRDLLLSDRSLENLQRWITEHWYGVLLIVIGFLALLVVIARFCGRQQDSHVRKKITQLYKQQDAILPASISESNRGLMVHPTAVKSKLPLGKKVRETKRQGKKVSYEKVMVKVRKSTGLTSFLPAGDHATVSRRTLGVTSKAKPKKRSAHGTRRSSSSSVVASASSSPSKAKKSKKSSSPTGSEKGLQVSNVFLDIPGVQQPTAPPEEIENCVESRSRGRSPNHHKALQLTRSRSLSPDKVKSSKNRNSPTTTTPPVVKHPPPNQLKRPSSFAGSSEHCVLDLTAAEVSPAPSLFKKWRTPAEVAAACGATGSATQNGHKRQGGMSYSRSRAVTGTASGRPPRHRKVIRYDNGPMGYERQTSAPTAAEESDATGEWLHREVSVPASKVKSSKRTIIVRRRQSAAPVPPAPPPSPPDHLPPAVLASPNSSSKTSLESLDFPPLGSSSDLSSLIAPVHKRHDGTSSNHHKKRSESLCSSIKPLILHPCSAGGHHTPGFLRKKRRSISNVSDRHRATAVSIPVDNEDDDEHVYSVPYGDEPETSSPPASLIVCPNPKQQLVPTSEETLPV